ncbi:unnamed protein product [Bursaphelenchus okinawaensis]|uniref:SCP domain-containing protein n=1 Tax=Bursaphelenchus okinawaensis TaxID=465554 RepID=A0A811L348_9BILA|nr:unnamed protein product [Bursaphelenchus okinawaensis]CAG9116663.1 unnamed protein product [Bursaphelenchus okinawaensis]
MRNLLFVLLIIFLANLANGRRFLNSAEQDVVTTKHNEIRSQVASGEYEGLNDEKLPSAADMIELVYDRGLETVAQKYAEQCDWEHSGSGGENLASFSGEHAKSDLLDMAVEMWFSESTYFNVTNVKRYQKQPEAMVGHFTQLVWAKTARLGCGVAHCDEILNMDTHFNHGYVVVCKYHPPGNYKRKALYKQGKPCSQCPKDSDCHKNLCSKF